MNEQLYEYVMNHCEQTTCQCGHCDCEAGKDEKLDGEYVNLTFFKVKAKNNPMLKDFEDLVKASFPHWLDGKEHSYIEVGGDVGDQGIALMTIGLGHLLGLWQALSPDIMMPFLPQNIKMQMAGTGYVSLQVWEK